MVGGNKMESDVRKLNGESAGDEGLPPPRREPAALFAVTVFVGAALLFLVQPMFARMALPVLGGSPSVWTTSVLFFQAALFAGYLYAHASVAGLGVRRQAVLHWVVLAAALIALPIALPAGWSPPTEQNPVGWLLLALTTAVGLPFFALAATGPLFQRWFVATGHPRCREPYFLYAASNAGSLLALVAYPFLVEPGLTLGAQSRLWTTGYVLFLFLAACCSLVLWRGGSGSGLQAGPDLTDSAPRADGRRRLRWMVLAFLPSSLMMGVTTYLSTDIAAAPLLWVLPLALYLLTFILAFAERSPIGPETAQRALPFLMVPLMLLLAAGANRPAKLLMPLHIAAFFAAALVSHGELARDRPSPRHLTEYYLLIAAGGVLGGVFNALLAPVLFARVIEYPLALALACILAPRPADERQGSILAIALPGTLGTFAFGLFLGVLMFGLAAEMFFAVLMYGVPALLCFGFALRRVRVIAGLGAIVTAAFLVPPEPGVLRAERSFFGVYRVIERPKGYHAFMHGTTLHGMQSLDPTRRREPLTYFTAGGPIGQVFAELPEVGRLPVGVVGLGVGSLASYAKPGQRWTYYEIDPAVRRIASDTRYFTYLADTAGRVEVVLGDARRTLASNRDSEYGLLIQDAYSSDAVPVHLITREALRLYLGKVAERGIIAFNITNRHLHLTRVLGPLAASEGLACLVRGDRALAPVAEARGERPSRWLLMARDPASFGSLRDDPRWAPPAATATRIWTDDYSSILDVFRWEW